MGSVLTSADANSDPAISSKNISGANLFSLTSSSKSSYNLAKLNQRSKRKQNPKLKRTISVHQLPDSYRKSTSSTNLDSFRKSNNNNNQSSDNKDISSDDSAKSISRSDEIPNRKLSDNESEDDSYDESDDESIYMDDIDKIDSLESHHIVDINLDDDTDENTVPLITITPTKSIVPPAVGNDNSNNNNNNKGVHNERYKLLSSKKKNLHSLLFSDSDLALIRRHRNNAPATKTYSSPIGNNHSDLSPNNQNNNQNNNTNNNPDNNQNNNPNNQQGNQNLGATVIQLDPHKGRCYTIAAESPSLGIQKLSSNTKKDDEEDADQLMIQILKIALKRESEKVKQLKNTNDFIRKKFEQQQKITEQLQAQLHSQPFPHPIPSELTSFSQFTTSCASITLYYSFDFDFYLLLSLLFFIILIFSNLII